MSAGLRAGTNNDGYLQVNGTDVLTALSSGNVGIGTSTPNNYNNYNTLTINGTNGGEVDFEINGTLSADIFANSTGLRLQTRTALPIVLSTHNGSNLIERLTLTTDGKVRLPDNGKLTAGNGDDLAIYHDGTDTWIDNDQGDLYIRNDGAAGDDIIIRAHDDVIIQAAQAEAAVVARGDGEVELYHDNSKKFETTSTGAKVTGALEVTQEYPTARPTLDLNFAATKTLDRRITFTRDSLGTYIDENGILKYASNNTPRFDHDPTTGESLGLLIEESRTNVLGLSSDLTDNNGNDWDNINGTISVNQTTAPDGTTTAASFTAAAGNAEHSVVFAELVPTGNVTASVWVKTNTYSIVSFVLYGEGNSLVSYNLSTETVYNQGSNVSRATITEYPNGWYRISATMNCTVSNSRVYRLFASTGNFNAGGSESFYYWGPQVESGSFETSYIPTYASNTSVTRDDDDAAVKGTNFSDIYNETEGTIFSEFSTKVNTGTTSKWIVSLRDPANNNNYIAQSAYSSNTVALSVQSGGSGVAYISNANSVVVDQFRKIAASFKLNDFDGADGGTLLTGDTSGAMPTGISQMDIGRGWTDSGQKLEGHIKSIKYYRTKLSDAQLQGLTQQ